MLENKLVTIESEPKHSPNVRAQSKVLKRFDLAPVLVELQTISAVFSPFLGLGELNGSELIDSIFEYEIRFDSFRKGKYAAVYERTMPNLAVLGLLFENKIEKEEDLIEDVGFGFIFSAFNNWNTSRVREEVLASSKGKHLLSMLDFCSVSKTAKFWMSEHDLNEMKAASWFVSLVRTDSWERLSGQVALAKAVQVNKFL